MSHIAIVGAATGTGTFSIAAPAGSTDRTLNLPDSAGTLATAESTLTQFNATGSAPVYACRAWVNFNGTGTVAIRASGNVSSITDNGVGKYTVNFTNALADSYYSVCGITNNATNDNGRPVVFINYLNATNSTEVWCVGVFNNNTNIDCSVVDVAVFR